MQNIVLIGFMGTGKSRVGRLLAERLGYAFVDMDAMIEEREGRAISLIFAESGEPFFRALERALVQELAGKGNQVIATGGGIVLNADNIRDFSRTGLVVCLTAAPEVILSRVQHETHRPLLATGDKLSKIKELLVRRQPLYEAIPNRIETGDLTPEAVAARILDMGHML
jgi:shikimate kinase